MKNKTIYKKIIIDGKEEYIVTKLDSKYYEQDIISKKSRIKNIVKRNEENHESDTKK